MSVNTEEEHRPTRDSASIDPGSATCTQTAAPAQLNRSGKAAGSGAVMLTAGGLIAAFGAAACCGLPLVLASVGLGSAWLIGVASLAAPYQTILVVIGAICLTGGAVLLWRQRNAVCAPDAICARPMVRTAMLLTLALSLGLLYLGYAYYDV